MMKLRKLNIISWHALFIFYATFNTAISAHEHKTVLTVYLLQILDQKTALQEGLIGSTLVKAADGYTTLASLQNNDIIAGIAANSTQQVILTQSIPVTYLFEIQLETVIILAAPKQQFYDSILDAWVQAQDLTIKNHVGHLRVTSCGKLQKFTTIRQLTTQEHHFTIQQDGILAHNANIETLSNLSLVFGACSCAHPVVAAIGRTISLAKLAMSVYEMYQDAQTRAQELLQAMQEEEVVVTTRSYYEIRRKELLTLLEQYRALKQSVVALSNQSATTSLLFTTIPSAQTNQALLPSLQSELTYGPAEKQKLLQLREQELFCIETEINSLQITLMLHLQDHSDRLTKAMAELDPAYNAVQKNLKIQIPYHNHSAAINIAAQTYASLLTLLEAIENLEQKMIILHRLVQYYQHPANALLLKNSTNVLALCSDYQSTISKIQHFFLNLKQYAVSAQQSAYKSLTQSGLLSQQTIISIQRNLQTHRNNAEQSHNANAKIKQSQITHTAPPNDPDDEEKKKRLDFKNHPHDDSTNHFPLNIDEKPHGLRSDKGHLQDTPQSRQRILDLSRDKKNRVALDRHGNMWYAKEEVDGQLWVTARIENSEIQNCGLNQTTRTVDPNTGLSKASKIPQGKK